MSLRILFITEGYPPDVGGVATSSQRVARNLARLGATVAVCTFDYSRPNSDPDYTLASADEGVLLHRCGPYFEQPALVTDNVLAIHRRRVYDQFERVAGDFRPHVVLSFYAGTAGLLATYVAARFAVPHVSSLRGKDIGINIFSGAWLAMLQQIIPAAARVVCVNEHLLGRLALAFPTVARERASVIRNGAEVPAGVGKRGARDYLRQATRWNGSDVVAVFVGEPREKKGFHLLLRAVAAVAGEWPLRLLVVGPGMKKAEQAQQGELWARLEAEGRLHCTGHVPRTEALRIAAEGDLILMPSIEDGLANGLLEGMALGLCPVVSDLFADTVLEGEHGYVVRRNDAEALAQALAAAVRDAATRVRFASAAAQRIAAEFTARREAEEYLRVLTELAPAQSRGAPATLRAS